MFSHYWIKLHHDIRHDPKMGRLTDRLWRLTIELFLLAGELDQAGRLPETADLAWYMRRTELEPFETELAQLEQVGILTRLSHGWLVTHFAERQAPASDARRMQEYRKRQQVAEYKVQSSEFEVQGSEFGVQSLGFEGQSSGIGGKAVPGRPGGEVGGGGPGGGGETVVVAGPAETEGNAQSGNNPLLGLNGAVTSRNADIDRDSDTDSDFLLSNDNSGQRPQRHFQEKSVNKVTDGSKPPDDCYDTLHPLRQAQEGSQDVAQDAGVITGHPETSQANLKPDTPETRLLFAKINSNRRLRNYSLTQQFKSLEQKQKCLAAAARLGHKRFQEGLIKGLEKGLTDLASLVNWLAKWEGGEKNGAYQATQPAYRHVIRATSLGEWTEEEKRELQLA